MKSKPTELTTLINNLHRLPIETIGLITLYIGDISIKSPLIFGGCILYTCCCIKPDRLPSFMRCGYTHSKQLAPLRRCNPFMHLTHSHGLTNVEYLWGCLACAATSYQPITIPKQKVGSSILLLTLQKLKVEAASKNNHDPNNPKSPPIPLEMKRELST